MTKALGEAYLPSHFRSRRARAWTALSPDTRRGFGPQGTLAAPLPAAWAGLLLPFLGLPLAEVHGVHRGPLGTGVPGLVLWGSGRVRNYV